MSEAEERRVRFFEYFRERVKTAGSSEVPSTDRLILVSACLDALAMHWMSTSPNPKNVWGGERLRQFLSRHGCHDAWSRVSAPLIRANGIGAQAKRDVEGRFPFAYYEPDPTGHVATWKDDPTYADLESTGLVDTAALTECSYPGIVYRDLRCGWVHESRPGSTRIETPLNDNLADGEPRYKCYWTPRSLTLVISLSFLVESAERAVRSFEAEASEREVIPYVVQE